VLSKVAATIVFWIRDGQSANLNEYLYAIANNKETYLRSGDLGMNWKSVSEYEFNTVFYKFL
jgi:hypothetical protein